MLRCNYFVCACCNCAAFASDEGRWGNAAASALAPPRGSAPAPFGVPYGHPHQDMQTGPAKTCALESNLKEYVIAASV